MKDKLKILLDNAYIPYFKFRVSAVVVMNDGKMFEGVNVQLATISGSICAERSAIVSAVSAGYTKGDFKEIHIMGDSEQITPCCFICRQAIVEFFSADSPIICYNNRGESKQFSVEELCPYPFDSDNFK